MKNFIVKSFIVKNLKKVIKSFIVKFYFKYEEVAL